MEKLNTLLAVRHGEVANPNHVVYGDLPGFDLGPKGVLEAHAAADHLSGFAIDAVVSSPLVRAVSTATAIADRVGVQLAIEPDFTEWNLNPGWTGVCWEDLPAFFPGQLAAYLETPDRLDFAHESLEDLAFRMRRAALRSIPYAGSQIVIVSHQDPISSLILSLTDQPLSSLLDSPPPHASVTRIVGSAASGWVVRDRWEPQIG
ncbi:MAG: histidine phosphatase family protein [Armatimonadetes bacterium]|nr:MAG: histidine phosphatase family protein [Armatimonadota bacterium]